MGLIDQLKLAGEQASSRARTTVEETQLRHDLTLAYAEIGQTAYDLVEEGVLTDPRLAARADRIRGLRTKLACIERTQTRG